MPRISASSVAEHRARQQEAILTATRDLLAEGHADVPSLAEVARRAGMARPSIYQYYSSREELLDAVIGEMFPRWSAYVTGRMAAEADPGARAMTYVEANLHLVARGDHAIVSGLARGIDGVAHQAALDGGGRTIAVMASGLGHVYPKRHRRLALEIAGTEPTELGITAGAGVHPRGAIVTEYGAVNLHGKTIRERGDLLISIAHPDFRAELRRDLCAIRHFPGTNPPAAAAPSSHCA